MPENILRGMRTQLRALEPGDLEFLFSIENDPVNWRVGSTLIPYSRYQLEQYILSTQHDLYAEKQLRFIIDLTDGPQPGRTIGVIDLYDFDPIHRRAGVGILIVPEMQKQGYASEALGLLIRYGFTILKLHMLHSSISSDNTASIRLFQKAGFSQCATKKEWRFMGDTWMDELMFQLIYP
jgi:diamine N-acetyltransferase